VQFIIIAALIMAACGPAYAQGKGERMARRDGHARVVPELKRYNAHVLRYVPSDVHTERQRTVARGCDESGQPLTTLTSEGAYCETYVSDSTNTRWIVRFRFDGIAERIFAVENDQLVKYVVFDSHNKPLYVAPQATPGAVSAASSAVSATQARRNTKAKVDYPGAGPGRDLGN